MEDPGQAHTRVGLLGMGSTEPRNRLFSETVHTGLCSFARRYDHKNETED